MIPPKTFRRRLAIAAILGGLLGLLTSMANNGHGWAPAHTSQLLDATWIWVAVGMVPCFAARRWRQAALLSAVALWAAVLAYDLADLSFGVYSGLAPSGEPGTKMTDWLNFASDLTGYSILAAVAASGLALLTMIIYRGGLLGLLAQLVVPAYALWGSYARVRDDSIVTVSTPALVQVNRAVTTASAIVLVVLLIIGLVRLILRATDQPAAPHQ